MAGWRSDSGLRHQFIQWRARGSVFLRLWLCILGMSACSSLPDGTATPPPLPSLWGDVVVLGRTTQAEAPALGTQDNGAFMLTWTGADAIEARHYAWNTQRDTGQILALKAYYPFAQSVFPADAGRYHLLWLDKPLDAAEPRLYSALINADAVAEIGGQPLAEEQVFTYAAVADVEAGLRVVWSGGTLSEPALYTQFIDGRGRVRFPVRLVSNATDPALARINGGALHLFWLAGNKQIWHGILEGDVLLNPQPLTTTVQLNSGDRLLSLQAAFDMTHGYLFWQIMRADGTPEAWYATGEIDAAQWSVPQRLLIPGGGATGIQTGFNSGAVVIAIGGGDNAAWATPLAGQYRTLPVAVNMGEMLGVAYLLQGRVWGYQHITRTGQLLGLPTLATDRNNHLYLGWSQFMPDGSAEMRFTTTRG